MRRTIFHKTIAKTMRRDAGNVDPTVWEVADHAINAPCIILGHVNPSGYDMVAGKIPKGKKGGCFHHGDGGARRKRMRVAVGGLPAEVGKRGWLLLCTFTRECSQAASNVHGR
jgi:hypothetical protein